MLKERIANDLLASRKVANRQKSSLLRTVLGEIERLPSKDHSDAEVTKVLTKFHKNLAEMVKHGDEVTKIEAEYEMAVIEGYLPKLLSKTELAALLATANISDMKGWMTFLKDYAAENSVSYNGADAAAVFKSAD